MSECCNPSGYRQLFNQKEALRSLRNYEKKGLDNMARSMVDYLASRGMEGKTVLEAGGGIGAIQVELLEAGASSTVNVELSGGYEEVATGLLQRRGLQNRVERRVGDFTEVAADLTADDVVMNRVICCYPFMERLMSVAVGASRRFVAVTFPRDNWGSKLALSFANTMCRIRGVDFRSFIHPPEGILTVARRGGFEVAFRDGDFIWNAVVFEKAA